MFMFKTVVHGLVYTYCIYVNEVRKSNNIVRPYALGSYKIIFIYAFVLMHMFQDASSEI